MTMLEARQAQAALVVHIWRALKDGTNPDAARAILTRAMAADATAAGQAFARQAPGAPCLEHFATVLQRWQEGGALILENVTLTDATLSFDVTDCRYARMYADMGLDPELGFILSCGRDEPFARGYSPRLVMERSRTIMQGAPQCGFRFTWAA